MTEELIEMIGETTRISLRIGDGKYCKYMRLAEEFDKIPEKIPLSFHRSFDGKYLTS